MECLLRNSPLKSPPPAQRPRFRRGRNQTSPTTSFTTSTHTCILMCATSTRYTRFVVRFPAGARNDVCIFFCALKYAKLSGSSAATFSISSLHGRARQHHTHIFTQVIPMRATETGGGPPADAHRSNASPTSSTSPCSSTSGPPFASGGAFALHHSSNAAASDSCVRSRSSDASARAAAGTVCGVTRHTPQAADGTDLCRHGAGRTMLGTSSSHPKDPSVVGTPPRRPRSRPPWHPHGTADRRL